MGGQEHKVQVHLSQNKGLLFVEFDGIPFEIFLGVPAAEERLVIIDGLPVLVRTEKSSRGSQILLVGRERIQVSLTLPERAGLQRPDTQISPVPITRPSAVRGGRVVAHMPGRIVSVRVKPSDRVEVGDPMFVLVAMKMENTLVAPISGIVKEVRVEVGASVNKGDLLATIE